MKKLIRKIKMWWWKKHNPEKYYAEYWKDVANRFCESVNRATASMAALTTALREANNKDGGTNGRC